MFELTFPQLLLLFPQLLLLCYYYSCVVECWLSADNYFCIKLCRRCSTGFWILLFYQIVQPIIFIWAQTYREVFKSALLYLKIIYNKIVFTYINQWNRSLLKRPLPTRLDKLLVHPPPHNSQNLLSWPETFCQCSLISADCKSSDRVAYMFVKWWQCRNKW